MQEKSSHTVIVAMSGGVDSSVAAALLLEQGYNVVGVTMKTYDFDEGGRSWTNETSCCGLGAVHDARAVAASLNIPHYVVDFRSAFERAVVENFVEEYLQGRTPNPCVNCNREIKWGELLRKAESLGARAIATGHYARISRDEHSGRYGIERAAYTQKDQSYALWGLPQSALSKTLFPLGTLTKPQVREIAAKYGLRTAGKQESYEICFVPDNRYDRFLKEHVPDLEARVAGGDLVRDGQVVGKHHGYPFFTIGQRKGLGAHGKKMYVTGIDGLANTVTIGPDEDLYRSTLRAGSVNWVGVVCPDGPLEVSAKVRYNDEASPATVIPLEGNRVEVRFAQPKRAVTPGQSVVWYRGELLAGGGIIQEIL